MARMARLVWFTILCTHSASHHAPRPVMAAQVANVQSRAGAGVAAGARVLCARALHALGTRRCCPAASAQTWTCRPWRRAQSPRAWTARGPAARGQRGCGQCARVDKGASGSFCSTRALRELAFPRVPSSTRPFGHRAATHMSGPMASLGAMPNRPTLCTLVTASVQVCGQPEQRTGAARRELAGRVSLQDRSQARSVAAPAPFSQPFPRRPSCAHLVGPGPHLDLLGHRRAARRVRGRVAVAAAVVAPGVGPACLDPDVHDGLLWRWWGPGGLGGARRVGRGRGWRGWWRRGRRERRRRRWRGWWRPLLGRAVCCFLGGGGLLLVGWGWCRAVPPPDEGRVVLPVRRGVGVRRGVAPAWRGAGGVVGVRLVCCVAGLDQNRRRGVQVCGLRRVVLRPRRWWCQAPGTPLLDGAGWGASAGRGRRKEDSQEHQQELLAAFSAARGWPVGGCASRQTCCHDVPPCGSQASEGRVVQAAASDVGCSQFTAPEPHTGSVMKRGGRGGECRGWCARMGRR